MLQHVLKPVHSSSSTSSSSSTTSINQNYLTALDDDANDDTETYSTPPTTPMTPSPRSATSSSTAFSETYDPNLGMSSISGYKTEPSPAVSRRNSRPSSLHIEKQDWTPDIQLVAGSPVAVRGGTEGSGLGDGGNEDSKEYVSETQRSATKPEESLSPMAAPHPPPSHTLAPTETSSVNNSICTGAGIENQARFSPSSEHYTSNASPAVQPGTATSATRLKMDCSIMNDDNHHTHNISQQSQSASPNAEGRSLSICNPTTTTINSLSTNNNTKPNGYDTSSSSLSITSRLTPSETGSSTATPLNASLLSQNRPHQLHRQQQQQHQHHYQPTLTSPCFVHSFLEKGVSLTDWLNSKKSNMMGLPSSHSLASRSAPPQSQSLQHMQAPDLGKHAYPNSNQQQQQYQQPHPLHHHPTHHVQAPHPAIPLPPPMTSPGSSPDSDMDDEDGASLTRQLAETAVGVREMSKQLGRARVRSNIQNVLIITKARDNRLIKLTRELALYLMQKPRYGGRGLVVYVDNQLRCSKRFDAAGIERDHPELFVPFPRRRSSSNHSLAGMVNGNNGQGLDCNGNQEGQLRYWTSDMCTKSPQLFDFVVTLGGDGTVLFTSWLFQRIVPPVLPFALGSLGFLTNFDFADHRAVMDSAIDNGIRVNLRMRFTCTVYRAVAPEPGKGRRAVKKADTGEIMMRNIEKGGWEALEGGWSETGVGVKEGGKKSGKDKEIMCFTTRPVESFEVLNDLVVDRGPSPYVSLLELFGDEHHMTTVQADGLTVSTPTGSTAYSLSAGGSLVHPEIPAILITPICPHTLSFRPMLLPDSMELRICVPYNSRSTAWASFDGRGRVELKQGDHIKVTASKYPFPTVCADKQSTDWFHAISRTLKWNERERQKSFVVVEEGPVKHKSGSSHKDSNNANSNGNRDNRKNVEVDGSSGAVSLAKTGIREKDEDDDDVGNEEEDDDEEEEEEEYDEEEEKFDIDDSSAPEASAVPSCTDLAGMAKAQEEARQKRQEAEARVAALALAQQQGIGVNGISYPSSSSSPPDWTGSGIGGVNERGSERSGIETPDRFAGAHPHPPRVSPRHVSFGGEYASEASSPSNGSPTFAPGVGVGIDIGPHPDEKGERDHIHAPHMLSGGRSRIPRDRDVEADSANMKTPTVSSWGHTQANHHHHNQQQQQQQLSGAGSVSVSVSGPGGGNGGGVAAGTMTSAPGRVQQRSRSRDSSCVRRAFAVWGQDESDSNTSDSDV